MSEREHEGETHERVDVKGALGMSRRDLIRRGAVVGTLVWAVPVISSVNQKAFAESAGPGPHTASGTVDYTAAGPTPLRTVTFSFNDTNSGTLHYSDTNAVQYDVTFSSTLISGNIGYACGVISNSVNISLDGTFLVVKVVDNGVGPTDQISGDTAGSCPSLPFNPSISGTIVSGNIVVT